MSDCYNLVRMFFVIVLAFVPSVCLALWLETSNVDVCVEMEPKLYLFVELGMFLEDLLGCHVDVIRMHRNMNTFLRKEIERDGIYVI